MSQVTDARARNSASAVLDLLRLRLGAVLRQDPANCLTAALAKEFYSSTEELHRHRLSSSDAVASILRPASRWLREKVPGGPSSPAVDAAGRGVQALSVSLVVFGCVRVALAAAPLPPSALLGFGKAAMAALLGSRHMLEDGIAAVAADSGAPQWQGQGPAEMASCQLRVVSAVLDLLSGHLPRAQLEAEEARGTLYSAHHFALWLRAATRLLLEQAQRRGPIQGDALEAHAELCSMMMATPEMQQRYPMAPARAALGEDADLQHALVRLSLRHSLPAAGEGAGLLPATAATRGALRGGRSGDAQQRWQFLANILVAIVHPRLMPALHAYAHGGDGLPFVRLVVALLRAVPPRCPAGVTPDLHLGTPECLADLLCRAAPAFTCECCRARDGGRGPDDAHVQEAGWLVLPLAAQAAEVIRREAAPLGLEPGSGVQPAATAVPAVPAVPATQHEPAAASAYSLCDSWSKSLRLACKIDYTRSMQQAADWAAAVDALLPLVPVLGGLAARPLTQHQQDAVSLRLMSGTAPADLMAAAVHIWQVVGPHVLTYVSSQASIQRSCQFDVPPAHAAATAALFPNVPALASRADLARFARSLFQLHSTCCRLAHWALGLGPRQRGRLPSLHLPFGSLLAGCGSCFEALHCLLFDAGGQRRHATDLAAAEAHRLLCSAAAAQVAVASAAATQLPPAELRAGVAAAWFHPLRHLAIAISTAPAACVAPLGVAALHAMLQQAAEYRTGGAEGTPERGSTLAEAVGALAGRPQAAAALLASGTLPVWQRAVEQSVAERVPGVDRDWSANTLATFHYAVAGLLECMIDDGGRLAAGAEASAGGPPHALPEGLAEGLAAAGRKLAAVSDVMEEEVRAHPDDVAATCARHTRQLMPLAEEVAALLSQHWAAPEQVAAAQLEAADAAGARRCAHLRCPNVCGTASKRCTGCRAVRYCGLACSHADWRAGGHRKVCKVLAAAGQQQAAE